MDDSIFLDNSTGYIVADSDAFESFGSAVPQVAFRLRDQKARIIANWALRVATMPAFRAMPDLALEDVERHIPEVLDSTLTAISTSDPTMDPAPLERAIELASAHGRARLLDDFTAGEVLSEFSALCREVWSAFLRTNDQDIDSPELLREFAMRLWDTFDAISVAAVEAWVDAKMARISG